MRIDPGNFLRSFVGNARKSTDPPRTTLPGNPPPPPGLPLWTPTPTEERYATAERLTPQVYTIPRLTRIEGRLDRERLAGAVAALIHRNAALRSGFSVDADGRFRKYIVADNPACLEFLDLPGASLDEVNECLRPLLMRKPDLAPASIGRYHLLRVAPELHYLGLSWHHSVSDGTSARLALAEIFDFYQGIDPGPPAPAPHEAIPDDWAESQPYRLQSRWWEETLAAAPEQCGLPADLDWAAGPTMRAVDHELAAETCAALADGAGAFAVSEFAVAYAVVLALLARLSGNADVLSAFQSNGRRGFPAAKRSIGGYSNAVVLRAPLDRRQSFAAYAAGLGARLRSAIANELPPYHHVIASTGVQPRFGVNWFPAPPEIRVPGLRITDSSHDLRESDYQLNFRFIRHDGGRRLVVFYQSRELSRARIDLLVRQFELLAQALVERRDEPMDRIRLADLLPLPAIPVDEEVAADDRGIVSGFMAQVATRPEGSAIEAATGTLSYRQLAARAGGVAQQLAAAGIPDEARVAILARRNSQFVVNLLGVALRGGSFVVLDEGYPDQRLLRLLQEVRPGVLLHSADDGFGARAAGLAAAAGIVDIAIDPARLAGVDARPVDAGAPAYFLFTSGTTGEPEGVAVAHRPLVHFAAWEAARLAITPADRMTMLSGLGHDPLLRDIFTCLGAGATLLVPAQDDLLQPGALSRWVARCRPTVAHLTPPLGELLLAGAEQGALRSLRLLVWGGDLLRPSLVERCRELLPEATHVNFYGTTETPQAITSYHIEPDQTLGPVRSIPIGRATAGHRVQVVGADGEPLGAFEPGEVEVRSDLLSLGRLKNGEIVPFDEPHRYRTGDRGMHLPDGSIVITGRADDQVKIRGFRVEPAEVTGALLAHPAVSQAVVLATGDDNRRRLVAFTVDTLDAEARGAALATFLAGRLPPYMVPERFVAMAAIPLLPNGKIDRAALHAMAAAEAQQRHGRDLRPASVDERRLIGAWQKVLGREDIAPADSLVSLGGDSLNFVNLYLATEEVLGEVPDGWQVLTIRDLCAAAPGPDMLLRPVDTAIFARAAAITIVVAEHLRLIPYAFSGATTALFLVTGYFFSGLQLTTAFHRKSVRPLLRMMGNLLLPVLLFSLLLYGWKTVSGRHPHYSVLTLTGNFHDYRGGQYGGREYYLWYVYAMVQILLLILLATWVAIRSSAREVDLRRFCWAMFAGGVLLRFGLPALLLPGFFAHGVAGGDIWSYLPTTHLPTIMLGALVLLADSRRQRLLLLPVLLLYAAAQLRLFPDSGGGFYTLAFGLLLLFLRRVPIPRLLSPLLLPVSGASLFLYLTHFQFAGILKRIGIHQPLWHVLWALLCGVLLWRLYSWLAARVALHLRRRLHRSRSPEGGAAPV